VAEREALAQRLLLALALPAGAVAEGESVGGSGVVLAAAEAEAVLAPGDGLPEAEPQAVSEGVLLGEKLGEKERQAESEGLPLPLL